MKQFESETLRLFNL